MPREVRNIPCSHTTRAGNPCRAWAAAGTDPPACSAHAGRNRGAGGPLANQNARTHGFYGRILSDQELADLVIYAADMSLDDELACVRVALLLSYRQALAAGAGDAFLKIIHQALDRINEEWEIEL
jgi:hypothetical protein